jgi:hypothetical protein
LADVSALVVCPAAVTCSILFTDRFEDVCLCSCPATGCRRRKMAASSASTLDKGVVVTINAIGHTFVWIKGDKQLVFKGEKLGPDVIADLVAAGVFPAEAIKLFSEAFPEAFKKVAPAAAQPAPPAPAPSAALVVAPAPPAAAAAINIVEELDDESDEEEKVKKAKAILEAKKKKDKAMAEEKRRKEQKAAAAEKQEEEKRAAAARKKEKQAAAAKREEDQAAAAAAAALKLITPFTTTELRAFKSWMQSLKPSATIDWVKVGKDFGKAPDLVQQQYQELLKQEEEIKERAKLAAEKERQAKAKREEDLDSEEEAEREKKRLARKKETPELRRAKQMLSLAKLHEAERAKSKAKKEAQAAAAVAASSSSSSSSSSASSGVGEKRGRSEDQKDGAKDVPAAKRSKAEE